MASEAVGGAEFWLPSEFLTDDFFSAEKTTHAHEVAAAGGGGEGDALCFPIEFPYDCDSSNLESPVGSNTESDEEEEFMLGLTRRMAYSSLHNEERRKTKNNAGSGSITTALATENIKASMASSPESPLYSAGAWSCLVSSPPSPQEPEKGGIDRKAAAAWEWEHLLYAAAGEVIRRRLHKEETKQRLAGRGLLGPPKTKTGNHNANLALAQHQFQLQVNQFQHLKQQQLLKQREQYSAIWGRKVTNTPRCGVGVANDRDGIGGRPMGLSSWSPRQQAAPAPVPPPPSHLQSGSGMRAIFLNGSGARRRSCGTGVFLPRGVGSPPEPRKKPACSTVLVPARVVQALNLNLDDINPQPRFPGGFALDHQEALLDRNNVMMRKMMGSQKKVLQPQPAASPLILNLPPEWTY